MGREGARCCLTYKRRTFCVCLHGREHLSRPLRKQGKWNGRDYFPPFGSADIYGAGTHESHRDGQFAQMVAILGQHSNEKRGRGEKKWNKRLPRRPPIPPLSVNADADKRRGCKSV